MFEFLDYGFCFYIFYFFIKNNDEMLYYYCLIIYFLDKFVKVKNEKFYYVNLEYLWYIY